MPVPVSPGYATFSRPSSTQNAGTVITTLVPPTPPGSPLIYRAGADWVGNWMRGNGPGIAHITSLLYTTAGTAHTVTVMRPVNWTDLSAAAASGQAVIVLRDNPGTYSTKYKYPTPGGIMAPVKGGTGTQGGTAPSQASDLTLGNTHFLAFQYPDGTWAADKVSSVSSLSVTLTNNLNAALPAGTVVFWFGAPTTVNPASGVAHWATPTIASTNKSNLAADVIGGMIEAFHPGDPFLIHSNNATAAGTIDGVAGYYARI